MASPWRARVRRVGRMALIALAWGLAGLTALLLSTAYHLSLDETREVARAEIEILASDALRGSLEIGSIEELTLGRAVFHDVTMRDEEGRAIIVSQEVIAYPDLWRIYTDRTIHISGARVARPDIALYVVGDEGLEVSLARAFLPIDQGPTDGSPPVHILIDGLVVEDAYVHGDVPRYPGLVLEHLDARGRIDIRGAVVIDAYQADGLMTGPYPGETAIDRVFVHFSTDWVDGVTAYVEAHRGDDHVQANVRVDRPVGWPEDDPPRLAVDVHTDPLCARTLEEMGFPLVDRLAGCVRGWTHLGTHLDGVHDDLVLDGWLVTAAGLVHVAGELPSEGHMAFRAQTDGLDLALLVPVAPNVHLAGSARIELVDDPDDPTTGIVTVTVEGFQIAGYAIPGFEATGALTDDAILLERVSAPHLGGSVALTGRVGFDGSLDVQGDVDVSDFGADPNVARLVPGAHGAVRGHLAIHAGPMAEHLEIDSTFDARGFRYGSLRAQALRGRLWLRGEAPMPEVVLHLTGEGVSTSGVALGHVQLDAQGGGASGYTVHARARGGRDVRALAADGRVVRRGSGYELDLSHYTLDVGLGEYAGPVDGSVTRVRLEGGTITLDGVGLTSPTGERVALTGALRPRGSSDLHFVLTDFPLASIASRLPEGLQRLTGALDVDAHLVGALADPDLTVVGEVTDASLDGTRGFHVGYALHYADGSLSTEIDGDLGTRGGLHVEGPIDAPFAVLTDPARFVSEAHFEGLELDLDQANLAFLLPFFGADVRALGITGRATLAVTLRGTLHAPELPRAVLIVDRFALPGWTPVRMKAELQYVGGELRAQRVWIADTAGEIALAEAGIHVSLEDPPADLAGWLARIAAAPFHLAARLEPRRLDGLPRPLSKHLPRGITLGGSVTLYGGPEGTVGSLEAIVRWDEAANDAPCATDLRPVLQVHATAEGLETVARVDAFVGELAVAHGTARAHTPFAEWLATAAVPFPTSDVRLRVDDLPLESMPWTCPYASGSVEGDVLFTLGSESPDLDARIDVTGLRVHSRNFSAATTRPFHAALSAATSGAVHTTLGACLILSDEEGPHTALGACPSPVALTSGARSASADEGEVMLVTTVPLTIPDGGVGAPSISWGDDFFVWADLASAHLEPILAFVPGIADADIVANGTVSAEGGWDTLALEGGLDLRDGRARVTGIGQHLHSISAVVRLSGNRVLLPEDRPMVVMDADARAEATGEIGFRGLVPAWAYLSIYPEHFPVRREGAVLATLTGEASLRATIGADGVEGTIEAQTLEVGLPPTSAGAVQALEVRRDVLVIGHDAPELASPTGSRFPFHLRVDAPSFAVVRNDFDANVRADLDVVYDAPDLYVGGTAELVHGTFEVLGKRFTVQRGALMFVGDAEMDPEVLLVASYALPGRTGASVTITVVGRLSNLAVAFSSTESSDTGEIIALLVSGRSSSQSDGASAQQAGDQAANFLAGLTAGILTLGLREQFGGQFVPNVAVETGDHLGTVGLRVGFNADWLIPDFAREVVLAAYVEGFVSAGSRAGASSSSGSGGVAGGVSLEFQLPLNGVISGTYVPVSSGGLDLLWEP